MWFSLLPFLPCSFLISIYILQDVFQRMSQSQMIFKALHLTALNLFCLNIHWKDWCWSWNSNTLATWCEELTHLKRLWCWERLKAGGEGDNRGCNGWMASLTQWTWVSVNSGSWWWTGRPGMLRSMGLQRVGHDWATKLNWIFFASTIYSSQRAPCSQQEDLHIALWQPPQGGLFPSHSPSPGPTLSNPGLMKYIGSILKLYLLWDEYNELFPSQNSSALNDKRSLDSENKLPAWVVICPSRW